MFRRKKENNRIERENLKFAKRLLEKPAFIDIKSMDREFEEHLRYRKQILRVQQKKYHRNAHNGIREISKLLLPPLEKPKEATRNTEPEAKTQNHSVLDPSIGEFLL